jgi:hypothetical protein
MISSELNELKNCIKKYFAGIMKMSLLLMNEYSNRVSREVQARHVSIVWCRRQVFDGACVSGPVIPGIVVRGERSHVFPTHLLSTCFRKTADVVPAPASASAEGRLRGAHLEAASAGLSASEDFLSASGGQGLPAAAAAEMGAIHGLRCGCRFK